jgi:hypothetical protein
MPQFLTPRYLDMTPRLRGTPATGRAQKSSLRSRAADPSIWDRSA